MRLLRARPRRLSWTAAVLLPALVAPLSAVSDDPQDIAAGRIYLVVVAMVAFLGGLGPALLATALSFLALGWLFAAPGESIFDMDELGSLALFLVAALAISNLLERRNAAQREAAKARGRAERLQRVTAALVEASTTQEVVAALLDQGIAASGAERGVVAVASDDGAELEVAAWRNYPESMVADFARFPVEAELPLADVVRTARPLYFGSRRERDGGPAAPGQRPADRRLRTELRRRPRIFRRGQEHARHDRPSVRSGTRASPAARAGARGPARARTADRDPRGRR
jgi:hypothetical protein